MIFEKLYSISPVFLQNIMISGYGYKWKKRRFGGVFKKQVEAFKSREFYSAEQWQTYQETELRKLLLHCLKTVPYYQELFEKIALDEKEITVFTLKDLNKIPPLEKEEFRKFGKTSLMSNAYEKQGSFLSTSGSSGTPLQIYFSNAFHQTWQAAIEARVRNWAGIDYQEPRGMIGGRKIISKSNAKPPYYRYNYFESQTYFSAYHIGPKTLEGYVDGMIKNNVSWMNGYTVANYLLAKFINESRFEAPRLKAVITSSEKLYPHMRDEMIKAYRCKVFDSYSGNEACGLISESPEGQLLFSPDTGIMEVVDDDLRPVQNGVEGEGIFTGLINFNQPLIRYRIKDYIKLSKDQNCQGDRNMPVIEEIVGRLEDKIQTIDGKVMVRFHSLYYDITGIRRAQIIQNSFSSYTFNIEIDERFNTIESEKIITERLKGQINGVEKIDFLYPESIPNEKSGKFKSVVSKI